MELNHPTQVCFYCNRPGYFQRPLIYYSEWRSWAHALCMAAYMFPTKKKEYPNVQPPSNNP